MTSTSATHSIHYVRGSLVSLPAIPLDVFSIIRPDDLLTEMDLPKSKPA